MKYNENTTGNSSIRISPESRQMLKILVALEGKSREYLINEWLRGEMKKRGIDLSAFLEER